MNILKQIEELQKKIDELKAQCEKQEPMFELPVAGDFSYYVESDFSVKSFYIEIPASNTYSVNNFHYKDQAEACAKHFRDTFWFTRKAIEFADGYEFVAGAENYSAGYKTDKNHWCFAISHSFQSGCIYMTEESALKFCEWLDKHKPNGWK